MSTIDLSGLYTEQYVINAWLYLGALGLAFRGNALQSAHAEIRISRSHYHGQQIGLGNDAARRENAR